MKPLVFPSFHVIFPTVEKLSPRGIHQAFQVTHTTLKGTGNLVRITKRTKDSVHDQGCYRPKRYRPEVRYLRIYVAIRVGYCMLRRIYRYTPTYKCYQPGDRSMITFARVQFRKNGSSTYSLKSRN